MSLTATLIRNTLEASNAPVPLKALAKRTKLSTDELGSILNAEIERRTVHRWPELRRQRRFWHRSPEEVLRESILGIAGELALPAPALSKQVRKAVPGFPAKLIASAIQQLVRDQALRKYPGFGRDKELLGRSGHPSAYKAAAEAAIQAIHEKLAAAGADPEAQILAAMTRMEPSSTAPVSVRELRAALTELDGRIFDRTALKLCAEQKVFLSRHDFPQGLSPEDRNGLIDGQDGSYYVAIARRN